MTLVNRFNSCHINENYVPSQEVTSSKIHNDNNIWNLSDEDKRIAREERMSDADYIEAEERDDDNLDNDY